MKGEMHYVDLHYKGVRIRRGWRHLVYQCFVVVWMLGTLGALAVAAWKYPQLLKPTWVRGLTTLEGWKLTGKLILFSSLIGVAVMGVSALLFYKLWDYVADLQRLCWIIYTYPLYLTNDILEPNMFQEKKSQVKREIAYFPHLYYRRRKGMREITIRLDGSKFHKAGDLQKLLGVLEDVYSLTVTDIRERKGYLTYCMLPDASRFRISMEEVEPKGYRIPLMRGITWDISKVPHALVVGGTGGGKSFLLNILIRAFLKMQAVLYICDPKNSALADYGRILPYVAVTPEEILKSIRACIREMDARQGSMKNRADYVEGQDFTHYGLSPVILILDEYTAFADSLAKKEKDEFKSGLSQLVLKGRESGVFVILATQRPDAEYLSGNIRDQLGLRVTLGKMSADGYRMAFGKVEQQLKNAGERGRGYLYMDGYLFVKEFYSPLVPEGYRFITEAAKLPGVKPRAFEETKKASVDSEDRQEEGVSGNVGITYEWEK